MDLRNIHITIYSLQIILNQLHFNYLMHLIADKFTTAHGDDQTIVSRKSTGTLSRKRRDFVDSSSFIKRVSKEADSLHVDRHEAENEVDCHCKDVTI
jgi:hypothetical protein